MKTKYTNNQKTIYQIFPRNHTVEGTLLSIINDLDRIKNLGVDIIYLLPVHEIGVTGRKGIYGSPYAIKDYYSISKDLGTKDDLITLIKEVHARDMEIILDMVFNHTAIDSVLTINHDDYYDHDENNNRYNKAGGWQDVIDLNTNKKEVEDYLVNVLKYYVSLGVDGFRFDVASLININIFKRIRKEVDRPLFLLAESVDIHFNEYMISKGYYTFKDDELHPTFDSSYNYNTITPLQDYLYAKVNTLTPYKQKLLDQEQYMKKGFIKLTCIENHDIDRIASVIKNKTQHHNILAFSFINKGIDFLYAGEEYGLTHKPELFEKDPLDLTNIDVDIYDYVKKSINLKHSSYFKNYNNYKLISTNEHTIGFTFNDDNDNELLCLFNLSTCEQEINIDYKGKYIDLLTNNIIYLNKTLKLNEPLVLLKTYEEKKNY